MKVSVALQELTLTHGRQQTSCQAELQRSFFEEFGGGLFKGTILGWKPVSIVHYTRPVAQPKRIGYATP